MDHGPGKLTYSRTETFRQTMKEAMYSSFLKATFEPFTRLSTPASSVSQAQMSKKPRCISAPSMIPTNRA